MNNKNNRPQKVNKIVDQGRRQFIKQSMALSVFTLGSNMIPASVLHAQTRATLHLVSVSGYLGQRRDPVTGCYHLGNGYRMYNPRLMRFHSGDNMSPFGKGGINSYAYGLGDPINRHDPGGHFALLSIMIGAIVGTVVGAAISATAEGIKSAVSGEPFDWKQVGIGAALGFISGGFGAAAVGASTSAKVGLAIADIAVSGAADFGLSVATGSSVKSSAINSVVGAGIGAVTFGVGRGLGKGIKLIGKKTRRINNRIGIPLSPNADDIARSARHLRVNDVTSAAQAFFSRTTGKSEAIAELYDTFPKEFMRRRLDSAATHELVTAEGRAAINAARKQGFSGLTTPDKAGFLATPFRRPIAHLVAQPAVLGRGGFFSQFLDNDYAHSAIRDIGGPF